MKKSDCLSLLHRKYVCFMFIALVLLFFWSPRANAYDSFTLNVSFYQGVDLSDGMTEFDPTILTLMFGDSDQIELVLDPLLDNPFDFSSSVDFHFEYDAVTGSPMFLTSDNIVAIAVLEDTSFDIITSADLHEIEFQYDFSTVPIDSTDTILLLTKDNTYIKIGNVEQLSDLQLGFEYQQLSNDAIPEPSTLFLLGVGFMGIAAFARRRNR